MFEFESDERSTIFLARFIPAADPELSDLPARGTSSFSVAFVIPIIIGVIAFVKHDPAVGIGLLGCIHLAKYRVDCLRFISFFLLPDDWFVCRSSSCDFCTEDTLWDLRLWLPTSSHTSGRCTEVRDQP